MLGRRVGSWILERELGRGGMGAVYEARHATLQTRAAVKVLSAGLESEESFRQRFRREAELQVQLRHSNIARVLDYLEDGGQWFLVIEYLDRGSLADRLSRGEKVTQQQAIVWTRQALAGLGYAHQKRIVHRDIKPANLMFGADDEIVVMDFGIARGETNPGLTATGMTVGTPQYMSPEQILTPNRVDGRSDIYSLGVVLYELLAGQKPFLSDSAFSLLQAHLYEPPPPLRAIDPRVPPELEAIVMRALAKKADDRYPDCESMVRALDLVSAAQASGPAMQTGATVQQSMLYEKVIMPDPGTASPGELRDRRRRSFQRRLAAASAAILAAVTLLAVQQTRPKPLSPAVVQTATVGTTSTAPVTAATAAAHSPQINRPSAADPNRGSQPTMNQSLLTPQTTPQQTVPPIMPPTALPTQPQPQPQPQPPVLPPLPSNPQIAVIGTGNDPMLAAALEQEMERRLDGYQVADEHGDPDVDALLAKKDVTPKALGEQLLKSGFHILVLLRAEEGDRRTFKFLDQSATVRTARIRLNAYLLPANRTLVPGWTEAIEYDEASLAGKVKLTFIGATADLRQAINDQWAQLRTASGAGR